MSAFAAIVVSLILGPFTMLSFLLAPGAFLARNGALSIGYLAAASLGTILYVAGGVRIASAIKRRTLSTDRGTARSVETSK